MRIPRRARLALAVLPVAVGVVISACASSVVTVVGAPVAPQACPGTSRVTHSTYLVGDAGAPKLPGKGSTELKEPVLVALHSDVEAMSRSIGPESIVVAYLGDNVYWDGLAPRGHEHRARGERILTAQIDAAAPARAVFVLGNHDWHVEGPEGWDRALAQREFLERHGPRITSMPAAGCAGPDRLDVGEGLRLVFIDVIGFGHLATHPDVHRQHCPDRDLTEAYLDLAAEFDHPDGRHMALVMHHPLITAGPHGGHYTWKQHIFPLTDFVSWLWLPLPVIGSVYPISRQLGVSGTDASNPWYARTVSAVYRASRPLVPSLYVGGHDHSLQVHRDLAGTYYLVSGAGSTKKVDRVEKMDTLMFGAARPGYMRLDLHENDALELTVHAVDGDGEPERIFRHCIAEGPWTPRRPSVGQVPDVARAEVAGAVHPDDGVAQCLGRVAEVDAQLGAGLRAVGRRPLCGERHPLLGHRELEIDEAFEHVADDPAEPHRPARQRDAAQSRAAHAREQLGQLRP
ncbi:MAG: hypothetical protein V3R77_07680 [Candidatus Binatia bacterium]